MTAGGRGSHHESAGRAFLQPGVLALHLHPLPPHVPSILNSIATNNTTGTMLQDLAHDQDATTAALYAGHGREGHPLLCARLCGLACVSASVGLSSRSPRAQSARLELMDRRSLRKVPLPCAASSSALGELSAWPASTNSELRPKGCEGFTAMCCQALVEISAWRTSSPSPGCSCLRPRHR